MKGGALQLLGELLHDLVKQNCAGINRADTKGRLPIASKG
jgi:hypothetical protein